MPHFDIIAFDADDTLWHNEPYYIETYAWFKQLLAQYHPPEWIAERLYQTEMRNLHHYGYGIKAFGLSMIETALELTEGRVAGSDIQAIISMVKTMLSAQVNLMEDAPAALARLSEKYELMLITKGDLREQENKIVRSGVAHYFKRIEIVSDKHGESYQALLRRHAISPEHFLMVGNSLRSDILPVLALGGTAVYIPYELTWSHESAPAPALDEPNYYSIPNLALLPDLLESLETN